LIQYDIVVQLQIGGDWYVSDKRIFAWEGLGKNEAWMAGIDLQLCAVSRLRESLYSTL